MQGDYSMLSDKERKKFNVVQDIINKKIEKKEAMKELGYSIQHINRLLKLYEREGEAGFSHKGKKRVSPQALPKEIRDNVINLYNGKYAGQNFVSFTRSLNEDEGIKISRTSVGTILKGVGIYPPSKR